MEIDAIDWQILRKLQEDARTSFSELGRVTALTPPAVAERVRRMEASEVITGYRADLRTAALGRPLMAFIRMTTPGEERCAELAALARDLPDVLECHRVTGGDSYIMKVAVPSVQYLEALLDRLLPYGQPTTSIVLSSPVWHRIMEPLDSAVQTVRVAAQPRRLAARVR